MFTQLTDTMDALRAQLASTWPDKVACYSRRGGEVHLPGDAGGTWTKVTKVDLKTRYGNGEFRLLQRKHRPAWRAEAARPTPPRR